MCIVSVHITYKGKPIWDQQLLPSEWNPNDIKIEVYGEWPPKTER